MSTAVGGTRKIMAIQDKRAYKPSEGIFFPMCGVYDTHEIPVGDEQIGVVRITEDRAMWVHVVDSSGNEISALGAKSTGLSGAITVSTSAVQILAADAARVSLDIVNNGAGDLYLGRTGAVTTSGATMGIKIVSGGSYSTDKYTGALYGIYSQVAASQNVAYLTAGAS